jgi:hypothetical protein
MKRVVPIDLSALTVVWATIIKRQTDDGMIVIDPMLPVRGDPIRVKALIDGIAQEVDDQATGHRVQVILETRQWADLTNTEKKKAFRCRVVMTVTGGWLPMEVLAFDPDTDLKETSVSDKPTDIP